MILHVDVVNKIATFQKRDGEIVCGNSGYQIAFTFDSEWDGVEKEAVLRWKGNPNGNPTRVPIVDGVCDVPRISNADEIIVGVHSESAGMTTTGTVIPCKKSILCG